MRPIIAVLMAAAILGSVKGYMSFQKAASTPPKAPTADTQRTANYELRFTPSFAADPDPFQLYPAAVEIRRRGDDEPVLRYADPVTAEETHTAEIFLPAGVSQLIIEARSADLQNIDTKPNELTVQLEFRSTDNNAAPPVAVSVTLRPDWQRLVGETEIKLP